MTTARGAPADGADSAAVLVGSVDRAAALVVSAGAALADSADAADSVAVRAAGGTVNDPTPNGSPGCGRRCATC